MGTRITVIQRKINLHFLAKILKTPSRTNYADTTNYI
jgi:hypothetical protein